MNTPFIFKEQHYIEEQREFLSVFLNKFPEVYLGGSYALNALGLIKRYINDFDFFMPISKKTDVKIFLELLILEERKRKKTAFEEIFESKKVSEPTLREQEPLKENFSGKVDKILHIHEYINGIKVGVFFYKKLPDSIIPVWDEGLKRVVNVSSPTKIIEAKKHYIDSFNKRVKEKSARQLGYYGGVDKHISDLEEIEKNIQSFNNKIFFSDLL